MLVDGGRNHNSIYSSCKEGDTLDVMEDKHEEDANLQVLVKKHDGKYFGLMFVGFEDKDQKSLDMENIVENMIRIFGDETRKAWMPREEGIKAAKLLTFEAYSNIHRVNIPLGGLRLKESSLSLTSQTILRKTLRTSNPITQ